MDTPSRHFYEFDSFRIDTGDRALLRDGHTIQLTPKVFDILIALIENCGHTLTKNELMKRVWADSFVEEGNLNRNISTLRKALGDDPVHPRFIRTSPKLGYSFVGEVREVWEDDATVMVENRTRYHLKMSEQISRSAPSRFTPVNLLIGLLAGGAAVAAIVFVWNQTQRSDARAIAAEPSDAAIELYEKGRGLWQTRAADKLHEATSLLERAVAANPTFAPAHAALADAYAFDYTNWKKAEASAREAMRLDPQTGEPHASIGFVRMFWEWRLREAETEFKQATLKSPNYATAHQWYALLLAATARWDAAYAEISAAAVLEPASPSISADMCQMFYLMRRNIDARAWCDVTLGANPDFYNANRNLYEIYSAEGDYDNAVKSYLRIEEADGPTARKVEGADAVYRKGGIKAFWRWQIERMSALDALNYQIAQHYARLGDKSRAIDHLYRAFEKRDPDFLLFYADPVFADLSGVRRYEELFHLLYPPQN